MIARHITSWLRLVFVASSAAGALWLLTAGAAAQQGLGAQTTPPIGPATADRVDYNWDVRPILSDNCFRCHGPDERARMAGLRLDDPVSAYAALRSGADRHAIVPGRPEESEALARIAAENAALRMPPRQTNKTLCRRGRRARRSTSQNRPSVNFLPA